MVAQHFFFYFLPFSSACKKQSGLSASWPGTPIEVIFCLPSVYTQQQGIISHEKLSIGDLVTQHREVEHLGAANCQFALSPVSSCRRTPYVIGNTSNIRSKYALWQRKNSM